MRKENFKLSIVTPFYNEGQDDLINIYFTEIISELEKITDNWEIICIDDGSQDNTYDILCLHRTQDSRIKILKLSRNFGKEAALTAGLDYASGDAVIPIDADLQDPPSLIEEMLKHWGNGYDIVLPIRTERKDPVLKKLSAQFFYWFMSKISNSEFIAKNVGDFRLMDRKVVNTIKELKEYHRFMRGILSWPGFKRKSIGFERPERKLGKTKYNYKKMFYYAVDGIFSFSILPIRLVVFFGMILSFASFLYGTSLIIRKILSNIEVPGYTSIMVAVLFLGGIHLIAIGVVGEYIGRIYNEVKRRPIYVIDEENIHGKINFKTEDTKEDFSRNSSRT